MIEKTKIKDMYKKKIPLSLIKNTWDEGNFIPDPVYQRIHAMDHKTSSKLIELALMNTTIPTVYFREEIDDTYGILVGQERITAFINYLNNGFALKGLEKMSELNGKTFSELDESLQKTLNDYKLNSIIITKESQELEY